MLNTLPPYAKFYFLSNIFCSVSSRFVSRSPSSCRSGPSSPLDRFPFFPRLSELPRILFFLPPLFSFPLFSGLFPSRQFFLFLSFRHPAPFFSLFLQSVSAPLLPDAFFSPGASPPEHNISEHKPKHTDASFCRPKCRTRQIIKNLPVTTGMYKKHPTRPTKIPDLKTPAEQILSSPREIRKTTKNKAFPARTKALPVPNRKYRHKRSKNRQPD